jgi:formylglycine-generating enzyme required for sulfatase activity
MIDRGAGTLADVDEYRIVRRLRETTLGATYLAHDRRLDRAVVVRILPADPAAAAEILQAARALAQVSHPSICAVHRVRAAAARPYVVSSFARGTRLTEMSLLLEPQQAWSVGRAVSSAVAALHGAGVTHGRVDLHHVFLATDGSACLVGLSTARAAGVSEEMSRDMAGLVALLDAITPVEPRKRITAVAVSRGRHLTADDLYRALDPATPSTTGSEEVVENPYRGLQPFETRHAALFFGRGAHVADALTRLRDEPWLVVAGRSGAGKSSMLLAGMVPPIVQGALGERARWEVVTLGPSSPQTVQARLAVADGDAGLLVVVDPLEDVIALENAPVREAVLGALAKLRARKPGVRVLLTLRTEYMQRLGELGDHGRDLLRATYLMPEIPPQGLRAAVVSPAESRGFAMESSAMVDALLSDVAGQAEALPILSYTLHELWVRRDPRHRVLTEAALVAIGGAAGALANHGDTTVASLGARERREARRILVALASPCAGSRTRLARHELLDGNASASASALDALVGSRLVVAGAKYELSHGALARSWPRLREWLDDASHVRKTERRVEAAAMQWLRLGRPADALWTAEHLRDLRLLDTPPILSDGARAFLRASRRSVRRRRARRWATRLALPTLLTAVALGVTGWRRERDRRQTAALVAAHLVEARSALAEARRLDASAQDALAAAFERYDSNDPRDGEARWHDANALTDRASPLLARATTATDLALAADPMDPTARAAAADVIYDWMILTQRSHADPLSSELATRLGLVDDGGARRAALSAPGRLRVVTSPGAARVVVRHVRRTAEGRYFEDEGQSLDGEEPTNLEPGSYVVEARMPGHWSTRLPLLVRRGQDERVELPLPPATDVPQGFVYVPAGWSLFGSPDPDVLRAAASAQPEHAVYVPAFLVAEYETTFSEYLAFLATRTSEERARRSPSKLAFDARGQPVYVDGDKRMRPGELWCRPKRSLHRCQDWLRLPAEPLTWDDAQAYARWVAGVRTPGARLCTEREWERAARGADGRLFVHGDELLAGDANFQATYAVDAEQMGADEVGSFPVDRSIFGVLDLTGNVIEWVGDSVDGETPDVRVGRGGTGFAAAFNSRATIRHKRGGRPASYGLRLCVTWQR